ncbi:MAG: ECF transporter S component [Eubacteriales bacterium]
MKRNSVAYIVKVGVLSALALIIYFVEFPILPAFPWLMVDFSEVPVLLGGFALGPVAGIIIELIKNILHFMFKGATGGVGEMANFLLGVSFTLPAFLMYRQRKNRVRVIIGMAIGLVFACVMSAALNLYVFIPLYYPALENVWGYIIGGSVPVTAIKYALNGIVVFMVYPYLTKLLHKA